MNCVTHQSPGLWRHPDDQAWRYKDLDYWLDLARLLERGRFDGIFIADVLGVYDVYGGSRDAAVRHAAQVPVGDPLLTVPAMAAVTEHLGFGITASTGFEHPYPFARRMSTLDHLTKGRVGWNVVTSYLESGARNIGLIEPARRTTSATTSPTSTSRSATSSGRAPGRTTPSCSTRRAGVYADPAKVHPIEHEGRWYQVPGVHLSEPSPQRTPVIYQAGASLTRPALRRDATPRRSSRAARRSRSSRRSSRASARSWRPRAASATTPASTRWRRSSSTRRRAGRGPSTTSCAPTAPTRRRSSCSRAGRAWTSPATTSTPR